MASNSGNRDDCSFKFEHENLNPSEHSNEDTQLTCDVLCSLGASATGNNEGTSMALDECPRSHQLPLFLSKTYHMIDRCDSTIASWSMDGSNFVVKNVEKFASAVLPLYFKHSNFSSFARQLNFYGFRKLRTDPILTSDVDPSTACHVRFYHEKFQKNRPDLLHQIKRATKNDQQSKDDVDSLKQEVCRLRGAMAQLRDDTDRRLTEISFECNRRVNTVAADYDKLAAIVQQLIRNNSNPHPPIASLPTLAAAVASSAPSRGPDLMHSLSQAAVMSLQQQQEAAAQAVINATTALDPVYATDAVPAKRPANGEAEGAPQPKQTPLKLSEPLQTHGAGYS